MARMTQEQADAHQARVNRETDRILNRVSPPPKKLMSGNASDHLGRLPAGQMNKTEAAYAQLLELRKYAGEVLWWKFEGIKFRLADNTFYTPDFAVIWAADGQLELHEIKGWMREDANVKLKVAAATFPFKFFLVRKLRKSVGAGWDVTPVTK